MLLMRMSSLPNKMAGRRIQEARGTVCLAVAGAQNPSTLMAGLMSCLPPECRLDFSFSTGLKFSPWRPYRLVAVSDDPAERLWVATYPNVTVFELGMNTGKRRGQTDGWSALIDRLSLVAISLTLIAPP